MSSTRGAAAGAFSRSKSWTPVRMYLDEVALRRTVTDVLREAVGESSEVTDVESAPCQFASLFPAYILRVRLADGRTLRLFLKCLGNEESDHPDKAGATKELAIYRDILSAAELPVPRYYGSRWNETSERHELFLEYIDDWNLKYHSLEEWYEAARALARLHGRFAGETARLLSSGFLVALDAEYVWGWAASAEEVVNRHYPTLRGRMDSILSRYDVVSRLVEQTTWTLVHNDLAPKNVIADRSRRPTRICLIDWESAGVGCGLLDLVHLSYGLEADQRRRMSEAYFDELGESELRPSADADRERLLCACEAHKTMSRLAQCNFWGLATDAVEAFVAETEHWLDEL